MRKRDKYTLYGCGVLIGCILVFYANGNKFAQKAQALGKDELLPWQGRPAYVRIYEPTLEIPFKKRIRIIEDPGTKRLIRLEETLEMDDRGSDKLIKRTVMDPRSAVVVLREGATQKDLENLLPSINGTILEERRTGVFLIGFEQQAPDPLPYVLQVLKAQDSIIANALPNYLASKV